MPEDCYCGEPHYDACTYCEDSLCEAHALAIPGYTLIKACDECLERNRARLEYLRMALQPTLLEVA
jgi:hypothetical protein